MAQQEPILVQLSIDGKIAYDVADFQLEETLSEVPDYRVTVLDQVASVSALLGKPCQIRFVKDVYAELTCPLLVPQS